MSGLRPNEIEAAEADRAAGSSGGGAPGGGASGGGGEGARGVIESDRKCLSCGYSLRGLPVGGNCPECGAATTIPAGIDHPLSLMPVPAIQRLKWGCWAVFWCLIAGLVLAAVRAGGIFPEALTLSALAALSVSWQVAVRFATPALDLPQAMLRGFSRRGKLRAAAQWSQLGWVVAAAGALLLLAVGKPSPQLDIVPDLMKVGLAAGVAGLVLLALMFERLSEWTREADGEKYFNWIAWVLPVSVLMLMWSPGWSSRLGVLMTIAAAVTLLLYPVAVLILARSVGLSVHHAIEHELRRERQDERRAKFFEKVVEPHVAGAGDGSHRAPEEIKLAEPSAKGAAKQGKARARKDEA